MTFHLLNPRTNLPECANRRWFRSWWFRWFGFVSAPYTTNCKKCRQALSS